MQRFCRAVRVWYGELGDAGLRRGVDQAVEQGGGSPEIETPSSRRSMKRW